MTEYNNIALSPITGAVITPQLLSTMYLAPSRLCKGARVLFEMEGSCAVGTDPDVGNQLLTIDYYLDKGTANELHVFTYADTVAAADSPSWVSFSQGFVVGSDSKLYLQILPAVVNPETAHATFENTDERFTGTIGAAKIDTPLISATGIGSTVAAFDLALAHRVSVYVTFSEILADTVLTVLAARHILRMDNNGNTAGE